MAASLATCTPTTAAAAGPAAAADPPDAAPDPEAPDPAAPPVPAPASVPPWEAEGFGLLGFGGCFPPPPPLPLLLPSRTCWGLPGWRSGRGMGRLREFLASCSAPIAWYMSNPTKLMNRYVRYGANAAIAMSTTPASGSLIE